MEGDLLRTDAGSCYRIDHVAESAYEHIAYVLTCTRLGKGAVQFGDPGVRHWQWMPRSPKGGF